MARKRFDPIETSRRIEAAYQDYLSTTIHFDDERYQRQLTDLLARPRFLAKGPYLEMAWPYVASRSIRELVDEGVLCGSMLSLGDIDMDRKLYLHQERAIRKAHGGRNYIVVTGTGSGKTECFLLPILNDILDEFEREGPSAGIRAILLYPMNALANDQLKRLRELLAGTDITFGRYTGETEQSLGDAKEKWSKENPGKTRLPNELISREEMQKNPPNILLTNYSMLEYMLLRPSDAKLFGHAFGGHWRHLSIDEAHVYSGALGSEIALLIRRLKARVESEIGRSLALHCYATSATIGSDSEEDLSKIAKFAGDLFGEHFETDPAKGIDVITSERDKPNAALAEEAAWRLEPEGWDRIAAMLPDLEGEHVDKASLVDELARDGAPEEACDAIRRSDDEGIALLLGKLLLGEELSIALVNVATSRELLDLTNGKELGSLGLPGLDGGERSQQTLASVVEVLSYAQRSKSVPVLSARYHSFLRAPEGLFLNLSKRELLTNKSVSSSSSLGDYAVPAYEVSVCRHCGQAYILGKVRTADSRDERAVPWLDPKHEGTQTLDEDYTPSRYFRIIESPDPSSELDEEEQLLWLCPECGSVDEDADSPKHRFDHPVTERVPVALYERDEEDERNRNSGHDENDQPRDARCHHCGYQNRYAIQPMRVSPEAAGSVVCYELVRGVPAFDDGERQNERSGAGMRSRTEGTSGSSWASLLQLKNNAAKDRKREEVEDDDPGSIICFSDRRQDAAFFAPAFERTYERITIRQIIREGVQELAEDGSCNCEELARWIRDRDPETFGNGFAEFVRASKNERYKRALAAVIDELMPEDSRNSLEGLGVVSIQPRAYLKFMRSADGAGYVGVVTDVISQITGLAWRTTDTEVVLRRCLESLRERGALNRDKDVFDLQRSRTGTRPISPDPCRSDIKYGKAILFAGSPGNPNLRREFLRRYVRRRFDAVLSAEDETEVLSVLHTSLTEILKSLHPRREYLVKAKRGGWLIDPALWELGLASGRNGGRVCAKCGCETYYDTGGVCPTRKCDGELIEMADRTGFTKDDFYKKTYRDDPKPIRIEEHTAQLSSDEARIYQNDFVKGKINVLSCTTTFELGVDVGDLRAVFLRDVPPSPANYAQRAGRTGRRAGMPGYAVTFARLRPHDLAYFVHPDRIVKGEIAPPSCYLSNATIALRHVFAVALSQYFRDMEHGEEFSSHFNDFLALDEAQPEGMRRMESYLRERPYKIERQIESFLPKEARIASKESGVDLDDWGWVDALVNPEHGRLKQAHARQKDDYDRLQDAIDRAIAADKKKLALVKQIAQESVMSRNTIGVLAENGVLPKYGFPTDLVSMRLEEDESKSTGKTIDLSRGLSLAIREYAPGSEIVARKRVWKSVGIRKMPDKPLHVRRYGYCPKCGAFGWAEDTDDKHVECARCGADIYLNKRLIVPSDGFEGQLVETRRAGERRPRNYGFTKANFWERWREDSVHDQLDFPGGSIDVKASKNGRVVLTNLGPSGAGYTVCLRCGAAQPASGATGEWPGTRFCSCDNPQHIASLGTEFTSDVIKLDIALSSNDRGVKDEDWTAAKWALFNAAAQTLEIPAGELGIAAFEVTPERHCAMTIYDTVPGGAGRAFQLKECLGQVVQRAYELVSNNCCDEDSCCYTCLCNYFNQRDQLVMTRGGAKRVLSQLLKGAPGQAGESDMPEDDQHGEQSGGEEERATVKPDFEHGIDCTEYDFATTCQRAAEMIFNPLPGEREFLDALGNTDDRLLPEKPVVNVPVGEDIYAIMVWSRSRTILLADEDAQMLEREAGPLDGIAGWKVYRILGTTPDEVLGRLRGER